MNSVSWSTSPRKSQYQVIDQANKPRKSTLFGVGVLICCLFLFGVAIVVLWRLDLIPSFVHSDDIDEQIEVLPLISAQPTMEPTINPLSLRTPSMTPSVPPTSIPSKGPTEQP